jgi:hypothetical protein
VIVRYFPGQVVTPAVHLELVPPATWSSGAAHVSRGMEDDLFPPATNHWLRWMRRRMGAGGCGGAGGE